MCLYELILLYKCFHDEECFSHSYIEPIFGTVIYGRGGGGVFLLTSQIHQVVFTCNENKWQFENFLSNPL